MKKILTFVVAILAISLSSCKKDDNKNETPNPLIGEWALQSQSEGGREFKEECQEYTYYLFTEKDVEFHQFRKNGNICADKFESKVSYTISDNQIHYEANGQKASVPFSVKDDILTITIGTVTQTYKKNARKTPPVNPFVGTWKLEESIDNGRNVTTDCVRKSTVLITEGTMTFNSYYVEKSDNSCLQDESVELTYTYTDNKVTNIKVKGDDRVLDGAVTFTIENGFLVLTEVDGNSTTIDKYKKQ